MTPHEPARPGRALLSEQLAQSEQEPAQSLTELVGLVAAEIDMEPDEIPDTERVLALLDHVRPGDVEAHGPRELIGRALEEIDRVDLDGEPPDPTALTGDPLAWSRGTLDEKVAERIDALVGDAFSMPSAAFFAAHPEAFEPARRAAEAADEPGPDAVHGSPAYEAAMSELHALRNQPAAAPEPGTDDVIEIAEQDPQPQEEEPSPVEEQTADEEKPRFPLFEAELDEAIEQARSRLERRHAHRAQINTGQDEQHFDIDHHHRQAAVDEAERGPEL